MNLDYKDSLDWAKATDAYDPLKKYRDQFHIPRDSSGQEMIYLCGNSLGLQPKSTRLAIDQELRDWKDYGVEGHFHAKNPWMPYHEFLTEAMAEVVGGKPHEVVVMNTLSVNLHLMMVSFYRPTKEKYKIIIESDAFPSDKYAVESQAKFHGFDPKEAIIELTPRKGEVCLRMEDIKSTIEEHGAALSLVMIGNTNYYTGQFFDMKTITDWGHAQGAKVGFDCAHGAGNVVLDLHNTGCDFAVWCSYKYLNSGPGSLGGVFVHERHADDEDLPKFTGWWGHKKETRFKMRDGFEPIRGVESWQLSNPPILSMAAIWASLKIFKEAGIHNLRKKSEQLSSYLIFLTDALGKDVVRIITPEDITQRGSQISIQVVNADKRIFDKVVAKGVVADWREPDVIRIAPTALYNSFEDVYNFVNILKEEL